jgi:hypothetical protein
LFDGIDYFDKLIIPAVAAIGGYGLALLKFKSEKIWLEKYVAYQGLLNSIESIHFWGIEVSRDSKMMPTTDWHDGLSLNDLYSKARRDISRQIIVGTLLLSEEFITALSKFEMEMYEKIYGLHEEPIDDEREREYQFGVHAGKIRDIAGAHLPQLVKFARKDLNNKPWRQNIFRRV